MLAVNYGTKKVAIGLPWVRLGRAELHKFHHVSRKLRKHTRDATHYQPIVLLAQQVRRSVILLQRRACQE